LLGHKNGDITTHYSAAEIEELLEASERICAAKSTPSITLLRAGEGSAAEEVAQNSRGKHKAGRADRLSACAIPERGVTLYSGHIGNTSALCGSAKCLGRSVAKWMNISDS
jgi:hypothetical protein